MIPTGVAVGSGRMGAAPITTYIPIIYLIASREKRGPGAYYLTLLRTGVLVAVKVGWTGIGVLKT